MKNLQKIAVVMDADHIQTCKISDILSKISTYGRITVKRAYGDWQKESLKNWETEMRRLAIRAEQQFDGRSVSMALVIDTVELLCSRVYDAFAIISNESDYTPLAIKLRESGAYVIGVGGQKAPESFRSACDEFLLLEHIPPTAAHSDDCQPDADTQEENITAENTDIPLEEVTAVDDDSTLPEEDNAAMDGLDNVHDMLRQAWTAYQKGDGYANIADVGKFIKRLKPDFDPHTYGFSKLTRLIQAFPDRYQIKTGVGVLAFKCISPEGENETEEAQVREESQIQEKTRDRSDAKDSLETIHKLLRLAWMAYHKKTGYVNISRARYFIEQVKPNFNPRIYGFKNLQQLLRAYSDRYQVIENGGALFFQCVTPEKEDGTEEPQNGLDGIHALLKYACAAYHEENGYTTVGRAGYLIKQARPDFDPHIYGFETLPQLIRAFPDRYQTVTTDTGALTFKCITSEKERGTEKLRETVRGETER